MTILRLEEKALAYVSVTIANFVLSAALIIWFVVGVKMKAEGALLGKLIGTFGIALALFLVLGNQMAGRIDKKHIIPSVTFGLPIVPNLIGVKLLGFMDLFILERLSSLSHVGIYSLGYKYATVIYIFIYAVRNAWGPLFFQSDAKGESASVFPQLIRYYLMVMLSLVVFFSLFAKEVLTLIAASAFHESYYVVPMLLFAFLFSGIYQTLSHHIIARNKVFYLPLCSWSAVIVHILLLVILVPHYGFVGAAWATLLSYVFVAVVGYFVSIKLFPIKLELRKLFVLLMLSILGVMLGFYLQGRELNVTFIIGMKCFILVVYGLFVLFFFLYKKEREHMRDYLNVRIKSLSALFSKKR
jgi:O-antigen/teichoic acid export membrane protein